MVKEPMRPLEIGVLAGFDQSEAAAQLLQAGAAEDRYRHQAEQRAMARVSGKMGDKDRTHDLIPLWRALFRGSHTTGPVRSTTAATSAPATRASIRTAKFDELTDKALT